MATISVEINDCKATILKEKAWKLGLEPEQFVLAAIEDLLGQPEVDFRAAMERVLSKNAVSEI